jgi:hypothetical protein
MAPNRIKEAGYVAEAYADPAAFQGLPHHRRGAEWIKNKSEIIN